MLRTLVFIFLVALPTFTASPIVGPTPTAPSTAPKAALNPMVNPAQLRRIMPNLSLVKAMVWAPKLNFAMAKFGIDTPLRVAAFLSQVAHESGEFRWLEEIWGPTAAQRRYEGRLDLGNVVKGDGFKYRGRGPIQITGRANYAACSKAIGYDILNQPDLAKQIGVGSLVAGWYWASRGLNRFADEGDIVAVSKKVNGGTNGLHEREAYYERALAVLGVK